MATDRFGQQDKISDAKEILTLISQDLRGNTGQGSQHNPLTLSACVTNMFDINTAQVLTADSLAASGDLFTVNSASALERFPIGGSFTFIQSDSISLSYTACPNVIDGASVYLGSNQNSAFGYTATGGSQVVVTGASWFFHGPQVNVGDTVGGGGERLALRIDQNANTAQEIVNADTGAAAGAALRIKNVAGAGGDDALDTGVTSTGFTPSGLTLADMAFMQAGANLAGGLLVRTLAATPLVFGVNVGTEVARMDANGLTVPDNVYLNMGINLDMRMRYDEATDDRLEVEGADWLFDSLIVNVGEVGGGGELLAVRVDQDAVTGQEIVNADANTSAAAFYRAKNVAGAGGDDALSFGVLGTGFTTAAPVEQDGAVVQTGANISGALTIRTIPDTNLILATAATRVNLQVGSAGLEVNPGGLDLDTQIQSDVNTHAFFLRGSDGWTALGTSAPDGNLHIFKESAGAVTAHVDGNLLVLEAIGEDGDDEMGMSFLASDEDVDFNTFSNIIFGHPANNDAGRIRFQHTLQYQLQFYLDSVKVFHFTKAGGHLDAGILDLNGLPNALVLDADADTTISAPTDDQMDFEVGGTDRFVITNTNADFPVGHVRINTPDANTFMTTGLEIDQKGADDEALALRDSTDIAHGITDVAETDTYALAGKAGANTGGLLLSGLSEGGTGMRIQSYHTTDTTTQDATAAGSIILRAFKKSGTGTGNIASGQNVLNVQGRIGGVNRNLMIVVEDGDIYLDTVVNENAWDDYDDLALLHGLRASLVPDGHELKQRFGEFINYARPILERTGAVVYNEDGHHFVATKKLQMLTIDALRQVATKAFERIDILEHRMEVLESRGQK